MGSYLRFLLLSAVLIAVASAYTVEERDVEVFIPSLRQVGTIPPPRHYNAPVNPKAGGPDDFETLPYRYGFRLENTFDVVSGDAQYYRLCPLVPEFLDDDYELHVQVTSKTLCTGCNDNAQFLSLRVYTTAGLFDDGGILVKTNTPGSNCGGTSHISFNVKDLKASTPDGNVWIQVSYFSGTFDYALHFWKGSVLNWGGQTCTYPATASDVFSPCLSSFNNIFDCDNGIYEPTKEQCDLAIAEIGCTAECICAAPFRPDTLGGCTTCGNGLLELPFSEVCDTGLDPHCDVTCKKCVDGFVLDPNGKCSTCGNGVKEVGESCDAALSALCSDVTCTCTEGCVGDGNGGCTLCGNGDVDPGEYCDAADPGCNADCTACAAGRVSLPREGTDDHNRCSLCGNGVVDDGEVCDSFDFNCNDACDGCTRYHSPNAQGVCSRCGNGLLDKGEVCDSFRPGCKADCSGCQRGLVALVAGNSLGECTHCGNGVLEDDEVCDTALDPLSCASDCSSCHYPFVSVKRRCVTCGNGVRDRTVIGGKDEVCDAAQPGCRADCSACEDGYVPAVDAAGSCIATCENCCASLPKETASSTNGAGSSAASVFLAACVLIVMVVFN